MAVRGQVKRKDLQGRTFNVSTAKTFLGRLIARAGKGEEIYIVSGHRRFLLQELPEIDPIPLRPEGYFARAYTKEEITLENKLAKSSVIEAPKDLE